MIVCNRCAVCIESQSATWKDITTTKNSLQKNLLHCIVCIPNEKRISLWATTKYTHRIQIPFPKNHAPSSDQFISGHSSMSCSYSWLPASFRVYTEFNRMNALRTTATAFAAASEWKWANKQTNKLYNLRKDVKKKRIFDANVWRAGGMYVLLVILKNELFGRLILRFINKSFHIQHIQSDTLSLWLFCEFGTATMLSDHFESSTVKQKWNALHLKRIEEKSSQCVHFIKRHSSHYVSVSPAPIEIYKTYTFSFNCIISEWNIHRKKEIRI